MGHLTAEDVETLEVHADYMDRCGRKKVAEAIRRAVEIGRAPSIIISTPSPPERVLVVPVPDPRLPPLRY